MKKNYNIVELFSGIGSQARALKNIGITEYSEKYKIISNLSKYSLENASETIGEAFADYYSNGSKSQKISKEIIKVMKGMI